MRNWPVTPCLSAQAAINTIATLTRFETCPRVEIVMSYAGVSGALVQALVAQGVQGLVAAGTGNGSLHRDLETALLSAQAAGVKVVRATRCANGQVLGLPGDALADSKGLSPVKARIALMLALL